MGAAEKAVPDRDCALGGRWAELEVLSSSVTEIHGFTSLLKRRVKLNVDWELSGDKMVQNLRAAAAESQRNHRCKGKRRVCAAQYTGMPKLCA